MMEAYFFDNGYEKKISMNGVTMRASNHIRMK
jgi:hypothetical protein